MGNYCCQKFHNERLVGRKYSKKKSHDDTTQNQDTSQKTIYLLNKKHNNLGYQQFEAISAGLLGEGAQGRVLRVLIYPKNQTNKIFSNLTPKKMAMKQICKQKLNKSSKINSIILEHKIMSTLECPFFLNLVFSEEDSQNIYLITEIAQGGDLFSFCENSIGKGDLFRQLGVQAIKFILAGVLIGLQFLRNYSIVYRDLKLQNILIGKDGYPLLTDFGLSVENSQITISQCEGTIEYLAPEMVSQQEYDYGIDLWALGVFLYYLMFNEYPYLQQEILSNDFSIICKQHQKKYCCKRLNLKNSSFINNDTIDLVNSLLMFKKQSRLGYFKIKQLKEHHLFHDLDWEKYYRKEYQSPLKNIIQKYPIHQRNTDVVEVFKFKHKNQYVRSDTMLKNSQQDIITKK